MVTKQELIKEWEKIINTINFETSKTLDEAERLKTKTLQNISEDYEVLSDLIYIYFDGEDNVFKTKIHTPNYEALHAMYSLSRFVHYNDYDIVLRKVLDNIKCSDKALDLTLDLFQEEVFNFKESINQNKMGILEYFKNYPQEGFSNETILHFPKQDIADYCKAKGVKDDEYCIQYIVPLKNIIKKHDQFIVYCKDNIRIDAPNTYYSEDNYKMNLIYKDIEPVVFKDISKEDIELLKQYTNIYTKIKTSKYNYTDLQLTGIAHKFNDKRLLELTQDKQLQKIKIGRQ